MQATVCRRRRSAVPIRELTCRKDARRNHLFGRVGKATPTSTPHDRRRNHAEVGERRIAPTNALQAEKDVTEAIAFRNVCMFEPGSVMAMNRLLASAVPSSNFALKEVLLAENPKRTATNASSPYLRLDSAPYKAQDEAIEVLEKAGQPVVRIAVEQPYSLGEEFFRWEIATAVGSPVSCSRECTSSWSSLDSRCVMT